MEPFDFMKPVALQSPVSATLRPPQECPTFCPFFTVLAGLFTRMLSVVIPNTTVTVPPLVFLYCVAE
ncbi:hypothetical protein DKG71_25730 [Streptomyces sp. NEAU-S7GS2]|nr:hypothetical protein DKG71_25730 [Streptomyces sp. NEAU-S7GS2]